MATRGAGSKEEKRGSNRAGEEGAWPRRPWVRPQSGGGILE